MTILEKVRAGEVPPEVKHVADDERVDVQQLCESIMRGHVVIPANVRRKAEGLLGIGTGLRTKVNANIGTSRDYPEVERELAKLAAAIDAGADSVMDLSTGGDLRTIRRKLMDNCPVTVGSVCIYEAGVQAVENGRGIMDMPEADIIDAFLTHAEDGVDFITIHAGVTREVVKVFEAHPRTCGIVSRGGTFLYRWMMRHDAENPYYARFGEVLDMAREYDVTLSLGDGMRPGSLADADDRAQLAELDVLADLARRARDAGVQAIIEGPGHVPLHLIADHIRHQKKVCDGAPYYVLGPLVTDVAPGYDHITAAIGGAVAASAGADFLCYVTPTEHLSLPGPEDVRTGVIASRIAAHAGDIAKGIPGAADWDRSYSGMRRHRDWEQQLANCMDPKVAQIIRLKGRPHSEDVCSMCGEYCVFRLQDEAKES